MGVTARFIPVLDDLGRWAVQDTALPFKALMSGSRDTTRDAAQSAADLYNAIMDGAPSERLDGLRALRERLRSVAPMIEDKTIR